METDIGEVTPGITALEYAQRRSKLANKLPKHAIAVVAAAEVQYRAAGIFYEYNQDPDFFYLTGAQILHNWNMVDSKLMFHFARIQRTRGPRRHR